MEKHNQTLRQSGPIALYTVSFLLLALYPTEWCSMHAPCATGPLCPPCRCTRRWPLDSVLMTQQHAHWLFHWRVRGKGCCCHPRGIGSLPTGRRSEHASVKHMHTTRCLGRSQTLILLTLVSDVPLSCPLVRPALPISPS